MKQLVTFRKTGTTCIVEYNEERQLCFFNVGKTLEPEAFEILLNIVCYQDRLQTYVSKKLAYIQPAPTDTSFTAFWDLYNHKVGDKKKVQKYWNTMPEEERIKAIHHINRYFHSRLDSKIEKMYPSTYLHREEWNN